jgi:hypothetical protein
MSQVQYFTHSNVLANISGAIFSLNVYSQSTNQEADKGQSCAKRKTAIPEGLCDQGKQLIFL